MAALWTLALAGGAASTKAASAAPTATTATTSSGGTALSQLSIEDLMNVEVSTVSRRTERWWTAPGAIDVVTDEDIRRSGALTLPDALRLATGVHVGQSSAREWGIAVRGFNVNSSNKLNVQLDGRSLFTPFFSGVLWDAQDTMMEDIDRIEVMRGPAGALWGAYAVNGFIQILTKPAWATQGLLASVLSGTDNPLGFSVRYGGKVSDRTFYRVYAKYDQYRWTYTNGTDRRAAPDTDFAQAGFRADTRISGGNVFTLEGDVYTNKGTPRDETNRNEASGANLTGHWRHAVGDSEFNAVAYYDYTSKHFTDPFDEERHTGSATLRYRRLIGAHDVQVGFEGLVSRDHIKGDVVYLDPESHTYGSASVYGYDAFALVPERWTLTAGTQLLDTTFSELEVQPTLRLAFTPTRDTTLWAAVSRAVRTPVRLDVDLVAQFGSTLAFQGNEDLKPESVVAYELGVRHKFSERFAVTAAGFVNRYDDVRSYESATSTFMALPWTFKNTLNVHSSGVELTVLAQPWAWMFLKANYRYLDFRLTKDPGSGDFLDGFYEANDPRHVGSLTARIDLPAQWQFDATLRYASQLPNPPMNGFTTIDARLAWALSANWELALIGRNLLDPRHPEFTTPNHPNDEVGRSLTFKATWHF